LATFPRVQLIHGRGRAGGKKIEYPSHITSTFKEAPKVEEAEGPL
jgi:hypothetical protein